MVIGLEWPSLASQTMAKFAVMQSEMSRTEGLTLQVGMPLFRFGLDWSGAKNVLRTSSLISGYGKWARARLTCPPGSPFLRRSAMTRSSATPESVPICPRRAIVLARFSSEMAKPIPPCLICRMKRGFIYLFVCCLEPISKPIAVQSFAKFEKKTEQTRETEPATSTEDITEYNGSTSLGRREREYSSTQILACRNKPFFTEFGEATTRNDY